MEERKERLRVVIINFLCMYALMAFIIWLLLSMKYNWELTSHELFPIFLHPLVYNLVMNTALWNRTKYNVLEFDEDSKEDLERIENYFSSNKVKKIDSYNGTEIYKVKNKHSIIPLKFMICKSEVNYLVRAPRVVMNEILDK